MWSCRKQCLTAESYKNWTTEKELKTNKQIYKQGETLLKNFDASFYHPQPIVFDSILPNKLHFMSSLVEFLAGILPVLTSQLEIHLQEQKQNVCPSW